MGILKSYREKGFTTVEIPTMQRLAPVLLGCFLPAFCCAFAQQPPIENNPSIPVLHLSSELVLLDAIVADRKTARLDTSLTANDFTLEEDGIPQKIRYFSQDKLPLSIVLLFDLTDSVRSELKDLGEGAIDVLGHLKPEDEVAVMTFSSSTQMLQPFTTDREAVAAAIRRAAQSKSSEGTFLDEDVYEGVDAALRATIPDSRRVLLFFTDGTANYINPVTRKLYGKRAPAQLRTRAEAREKLLRTGVTVSALIARSGVDNAMVAAAAVNPLSYMLGVNPRLGDVRRYAAETGGPVLDAGGHREAARLAALLEELRGRYTMGYVPSVSHPAGTFCRLTLKLTPAALAAHPQFKHRHYAVETRAGYYR
jgi:VWFA-related protein